MPKVTAKQAELIAKEEKRRKKIFDILYPIVIGFVFLIVTRR